jgi:hypothetical protein
MRSAKEFTISTILLLCGLVNAASPAHAQNLDLSHSICTPLSCSDSNTTATGSVFVQIDGTCNNGLELELSAQMTIIVPCNTPVFLKVAAGEEHTSQLNDCGELFVLGGVFVNGEADNGIQPTGTTFGAKDCAGGETDPPPAFNPC